MVICSQPKTRGSLTPVASSLRMLTGPVDISARPAAVTSVLIVDNLLTPLISSNDWHGLNELLELCGTVTRHVSWPEAPKGVENT